MANVLPGFTWSTTAARYRDTSTGRFVAKAHINSLLANQISGAEQRLGDIVQAMFDKQIAPGMGQVLMRDELRRLSLQNAALGKGGMEKLDFRDYGRIGRQLRDTYARVGNLAADVQAGRVTLPQAMNRIQGYAGEARVQYFQAERDALRATGKVYEERRFLGVSEHCRDCVDYASRGWQPMGTLPVPGTASACSSHCRCRLERREVVAQAQALLVSAIPV